MERGARNFVDELRSGERIGGDEASGDARSQISKVSIFLGWKVSLSVAAAASTWGGCQRHQSGVVLASISERA